MNVPRTKANLTTQLPGGGARSIELDFLRGIAILLVMTVHFSVPVTHVVPFDWLSDTFQRVGGVGVNLFFTLSGFLVGGLLLKEYYKTGAIKGWRFLGRRAFKIWPAYYVLIFFHLIVGHHDRASFFWQNFFQVQNYFGSSLRHTWSLAVEEHFYLFLTVLLLLLVGRSARFIIGVLVALCALVIVMRVVAVAHGQLDPAFRQTHLRMDSMLYGVILAAVSIYYPQIFSALARQRRLLIACSVTLCLFIYATATDPVIDRDVGYAVQGIGFALLLVLVYTGSGDLARQWWYRLVSRIGVYSYGIYLWHTTAIEPGHKFIQFAEARHWPALASWAAVVCVQLGLSLLLGVVMTRLVEWPSLLLRERFLGHDRYQLQAGALPEREGSSTQPSDVPRIID
jgi:peptidoglycan/LPS O-acetylase OafA/YrhL